MMVVAAPARKKPLFRTELFLQIHYVVDFMVVTDEGLGGL
jgi:hypothetical protein